MTSNTFHLTSTDAVFIQENKNLCTHVITSLQEIFIHCTDLSDIFQYPTLFYGDSKNGLKNDQIVVISTNQYFFLISISFKKYGISSPILLFKIAITLQL